MWLRRSHASSKYLSYGREFHKESTTSRKPKVVECGVGDAAHVDFSDLTLARQRAYRGDGDRDSYSEVSEKDKCVPGARSARRVFFGPAS